MCKMLQNIKQIATIGGGGQINFLLGWEGCRKSLGIEGLTAALVCHFGINDIPEHINKIEFMASQS